MDPESFFNSHVVCMGDFDCELSPREQLDQILPVPPTQRTVYLVGGPVFLSGRKFDLPLEGWTHGRMQFNHQNGTVYEYVRVGRDNCGWEFVQ